MLNHCFVQEIPAKHRRGAGAAALLPLFLLVLMASVQAIQYSVLEEHHDLIDHSLIMRVTNEKGFSDPFTPHINVSDLLGDGAYDITIERLQDQTILEAVETESIIDYSCQSNLTAIKNGTKDTGYLCEGKAVLCINATPDAKSCKVKHVEITSKTATIKDYKALPGTQANYGQIKSYSATGSITLNAQEETKLRITWKTPIIKTASGYRSEGLWRVNPGGDWNLSFYRCRDINITSIARNSLTNFTYYLLLSNLTGAQTDYRDVRIMNSTCGDSLAVSLPYDRTNYTSSTLSLWVLIPLLKTGVNQISVIYDADNVSDGERENKSYDVNTTFVIQGDYNGFVNNSIDNHPGMAIGDPETQAGIADSAVYLDGNDCLRFNDTVKFQTTNHDLTISIFSKYNGSGVVPSGDLDIISAENNWIGRITGQKQEFWADIGGSWARVSRTTGYLGGQYALYSLIRNGSSCGVAENGTIDKSGAGTCAQLVFTSNDYLTLGCSYSGSSGFYTGWIDSVILSQTTRSEEWLNQTHQMLIRQNSLVALGAENTQCTANWNCTEYADCNISDLRACTSVVDLNNCGGSYSGDYSEFTRISCNYCNSTWICSAFTDNCNITGYQTCTNITESSNCYNITGLESDYYLGNLTTNLTALNVRCPSAAKSALDLNTNQGVIMFGILLFFWIALIALSFIFRNFALASMGWITGVFLGVWIAQLSYLAAAGFLLLDTVVFLTIGKFKR